uniref:Uncharacterized protein n=1 Tax=Knipowitschia caucasica TaxID=637954 RepID=A0AAV2J4H9_KNICA
MANKPRPLRISLPPAEHAQPRSPLHKPKQVSKMANARFGSLATILFFTTFQAALHKDHGLDPGAVLRIGRLRAAWLRSELRGT